jgi:hypothetical protein
MEPSSFVINRGKCCYCEDLVSTVRGAFVKFDIKISVVGGNYYKLQSRSSF